MSGPLPTDAYYDQRLPGTTAVSPGGDRIAFTLSEHDPDEEETLTSLFVVPSDGSRDPHRLTRLPGVSEPTWGPDGDRLFFLTTRDEDVGLRWGREDDDVDAEGQSENDDGEGEDGREGEEEKEGEGDADDEWRPEGDQSQVWTFDLSLGGDARQVTDFEFGVGAFDVSPDGDRLVVTARDPTDEEREYLESRADDGPIETERLQHKHEQAGYLDTVDSYLFVTTLDPEAEPERLDDAYASGVTLAGSGLSPAWGEGGIAFAANYGGDGSEGTERDPDDTHATSLFLADPDTGTVESVTDPDPAHTDGGPTWTEDGRLGFVRNDARNVHVPAEPWLVTADGARPLAPGLDRTVYALASDGDRFVATVGDEGRTRAYELDVAGRGSDPTELDGWSGHAAALTVGSVDAAGGTVAGVRVTPNEQEVYAATAGGEPVRLTDFTADDGLRLTFDSFTLGSDDGPVETQVYGPSEGADPAGLVVDVHGGPVWYDQPRYWFPYRYWVSRGYRVANVNYRGSASYGRAFSESIRGRWGPREAADVLAAVDHLVETGRADPDRLFCTGFSQGGVNTPHVLARSDAFAAAAAQHGLYDMYSAFGTDDSHVWWENDFGLPWESPETYRAASTLDHVADIDTPTLVTAGGQDQRCPPPQAEQLYVALRKRGVPAKLVHYPETGHSWGEPDVATHRLEAVTEWFERFDPAVEESDGEGGDEAGGKPGAAASQ